MQARVLFNTTTHCLELVNQCHAESCADKTAKSSKAMQANEGLPAPIQLRYTIEPERIRRNRQRR